MKYLITPLLVSIWLLGAAFAQTAAVSTYKVGKTTEVKIEGTSSLHDWHSLVEEVSGKADVAVNGTELVSVNSMSLKFKVESIKSGKGAMDNNIYEALNSDAHPYISYQLTKVNSMEKVQGEYVLNTTGKLTIAGATQTINMKVTGKMQSNGSLMFSGSKSLKMTDYKVDPPTAVFGTIKTGDEITISFSMTLVETTI